MTHSRRSHKAGWVGGLLLGLAAVPCGAQVSRENAVSATVPSVGEILVVSPLTPGRREPRANLHVHGTVTSRSNGPFHLQVKLSRPFTDKDDGPRPVVNEVQARLPDGSFTTLGTVTWVTVATGPGGARQVSAVQYLVVWGQRSARNPQLAVSIPVEYRVVPP